MRHEAIYALYPEVVTIDDRVGALDKDGNLVEVDEALITPKMLEVKAQWEAEDKAKIDAKQSALDKLMALGLTEEEALALGVK
jgi:hypothetical protein